jgi:flagellar M-ring protein FliF
MSLSSVQDFWKNLSNGQRIATIGSILGLIAIVAAIMVWAGRPQMALLYGGLSDEDYSKALGVVEASGTTFKTTENGNGIQVAKEDVHRLRMTLANQGIPSDKTVGLELFGDNPGKLGVSDFEQRVNKTRAIQGELARTIMSIEKVKNARVMIVEPDTRLIKTDPNEKPKASVFIDTGNNILDDNAVDGIRNLVANSVPSVDKKDVVVVDNRGNNLTEKFLDDSLFGGNGNASRHIQNIENSYTKGVQSMLERVLGVGNVVARVTVDLNMDSETIVDQDLDPNDSGTIQKKLMHDQDSLTSTERALGNPGVGSNQNEPQILPGELADLPIMQTGEERESETIEFDYDRRTTETVKPAGGIKWKTASVFVSKEHLTSMNLSVEQLKDIVAHAIGLKRDVAGTNYINGSIEIADTNFWRPEIPTTFNNKWDQTMQEYAPLINTIIGLLVAIGVLIVFFVIMRKFRAEDQPEVEIIDDSENAETAALMDGGYNPDGNSHVPVLADALTPELLNELIRDRSDNVGSALRSWVNKK